jgi:hypothetical protein
MIDMAGYSDRDTLVHNRWFTELVEGARGIESPLGFADRENGFEVRVARKRHCPPSISLKGR